MTKTFLACLIFLLFARTLFAIPLSELDDSREWRVGKILFSGQRLLTEDGLHNELLTKQRPWYQFWVARPVFDPITFETDLERLRRYYEARGYYETVIKHELTVDKDASTIDIAIHIEEGPPIVIAEIDVGIVGPAQESERPELPQLPDVLPVKRGEVFQEEQYQESEQALRDVFLRGGFAHTESQRRAEINIDDRQARIRYTIDPGPKTQFGATAVRGMTTVEPYLIERELQYRSGDAFSSAKVAASRAKILALDLFSSVRIRPQETAGKPVVVPMEVEIAEKPHREVKLGVGYSTEEEFRAQAEWRHLNWLGGGRQLSIRARYSAIAVAGAAELVQPHFFSPQTKATLGFKHEQQEEQTFDRNLTHFAPRIDHQFSPTLTGFIGFRVEYNNLFDIAAATERALGDQRKHGLVSGPSLGMVWNTTDNPFYPKKGEILSFLVEHAGSIWGSEYRFFKISGEAKKYLEIGWETVLATRLKLGLGDAIGAKDRYPLFERYYAGGEKSVRGYGRRRLGPLSDSDDPLGGLSLLEGSVELRRPIWRELGGAVFVDFGQVAERPFDVRIANLNFAAGFGFSYNTPVGPIRLDVGFPFQRPGDDRPWQIHFSIGAFF